MNNKYNVGKWLVMVALITLVGCTCSGCGPAWNRSATAKKQLAEEKKLTVQVTRIADSLESIDKQMKEQNGSF